MNPVLPARHILGGQVERHRLDQRLDDRRRLMTHDVSAEQQPAVVVDDQLRETGGVLHRPPVGDVGVVLHLGPDPVARRARLVLGQPDRCDLGFGEHRRRHEAVIGRHQVLGVVPVLQQVVLDDPGFVVGDVLELERGTDVAEREHVAGGGALVLVDGDPAVGDLDPGQMRVEQVAVGHPAGRDQQRVGPQRGTVVEAQRDPAVVGTTPDDVAAATDLPLLARDVGETLADRVVTMGEHCCATQHDRHAGSQRGEHVCELRGDETAADDHQMLGQFRDPHDGVAGVMGDAAVEDRRRHGRAGPGGEYHLRGGELVAVVGAQPVAVAVVGPGEAGVAVEHLDVRRRAPVLFATGGQRVDPAEHPGHDVRPAHRVDASVDAESA